MTALSLAPDVSTSTSVVVLAVLMWVVTYPWRAVPLLTPGVERLPAAVPTYLRLVGPAVLAALAAVTTVIAVGPGAGHHLRIGVEAVGVLGCVALVTWRRNLLLGLAGAVTIVCVVRTAGLG